MIRGCFQRLAAYLRTIFDTESSGRMILCSPLVGVVAGLGAAFFFWGLTLTKEFALGDAVGYHPPPAGSETAARAVQMPTCWWAVLVVPTVGGLLCGLLVYGFAPEAEGHGTDAMVRSFHRTGGRIRARVPVIKTVASIITIGTGGSAGREGPIAQIGAGFGSYLADKLRLSERDRRLLMLAGAGGGIGAIFRAPLGGGLFVAEVLYRSTALEYAAVIPAMIAAVTAYAVFTAIFGQGVALQPPADLRFRNLAELPLFALFAVVCAVVGFIYVRVFYGLRDRLFGPLPMPNWLKPALGGLMLGALALWLPQCMAGGYGYIEEVMDGKLPSGFSTQFFQGPMGMAGLLMLLCAGKILATSLTISSGGSGGVFAPSLFIGAMLGGAFGLVCHELFPEIVERPEAFVLVGMGGFFAGVARVPLTAMLMVCEMSGSYGLLVPLMLVCIINVAVLSSRWSIYEEQVFAPVDSPAHQGDFVVDVLEQMKVKEVMDTRRKVDLVPEGMPLEKILQLAATSRNAYFPVVDSNQRLTGVFSLRDLRTALTGDGGGPLVVAADLATYPVLTVTPEDDLHTALRRFTQKNIDDIPVVDPEDPGRIVGMLSRKDLIAAYHNRTTALREAHRRRERGAEAMAQEGAEVEGGR